MEIQVLTVGPVQENCYLLRSGPDSKSALLIDPGEEAPRILEAIEALGVELDAILLTHTHFDHIGAVAPIARVTGAPVYCPELESHVLADIMTYIPYEGIGPYESWEAEEFVGGGERLELAGFEIEVFFTPGHSPGHVTYAFCDPDDADGGYVIASGDVLFQGSIGRTDLPGADHGELMRSLAMIADSFADETTVLPGHMGITTIGQERATNPFMQDLPSVS